MIIVTIKNNKERANHHRSKKKGTQSALIFTGTVQNNTELANHHRSN